ncbi:hypothetical protein [Labedella endophytica]|uniref:LPXTG cell wall anchor domain-containing protein n=1 Tax=Labedella endophytica TaxID=1523160 RepID=A0A3S0XJJ4_9MICO|nr:hypothetical protein [Labedella endophytica]RUQ96928.1 hypothetical protein ELQ94_16910 [Labedella endophytica]
MSASHGSRGVIRALTVASVGALVCGTTLLATSAQAAYRPVPENGDPGRLVLLSDPHPVEFVALRPGIVHYWQVAATLEGATRASLVFEMRKSGELVEHPEGLVVSIERCDDEWVGLPEAPRCDSGRGSVTQVDSSHDHRESSPVFDLAGVDDDGTHLLVAMSLAVDRSGDESLMGLTGEVGLGLTAAAEGAAPPVVPGDPAPPDGLPVTGADPMGLVLAAIGAIGLGVTLLVARTRRSPVTRTVRSEGATQLAHRGSNPKGER